MIDDLIEGARLCRQLSVSGRDLEIVVTEIGIVIRGTRRRRDASKIAMSLDATWTEIGAMSSLPARLVGEVDRRITLTD